MTEMHGKIGDNRPPDDVDPLTGRLAEEYADLKHAAEQLDIEASVHYDGPIENDLTAGRYTDFIGTLHTHIKLAEKHRVGEKEPFLVAGRTVDAWFKAITEPLQKADKVVNERLRAYQIRKANEERHAREEIARRERERAEQEATEAARLAAAVTDEHQLEQAVQAEELARLAAEEADRAKKEAEVKAAEISRTSGNRAQSSLTTFWDFSDLDRKILDLEILRSHIPLDALEKAVRAYIRAGGRELRGCRIFENYRTQVR